MLFHVILVTFVCFPAETSSQDVWAPRWDDQEFYPAEQYVDTYNWPDVHEHRNNPEEPLPDYPTQTEVNWNQASVTLVNDSSTQAITRVPSWWRFGMAEYIKHVVNSLVPVVSKVDVLSAEVYDYAIVDSPSILDRFFSLFLNQLESLGPEFKLSAENLLLADQLLDKLSSIKGDLTF